ncbi:MAG: AAA family ATPase [Candidatus Sulfotelmatobacter sp.]
MTSRLRGIHETHGALPGSCFNDAMIVMMAGLPGTGKTTLARELAARTSGRVLSKDEVRHALFSAEEIEYSSRQDDFCGQVMLETAGFLFRQDRERIVFLDGRLFSRRYQIENVVNAAESLRQEWRILECMCAEEIARQRLEEQGREHPAANRDFQLYLEVRSRFEAITRPKTVIDTGLLLESCVQQALAAIR